VRRENARIYQLLSRIVNMTDAPHNKQSQKKPPVFGVLSLAFPLLGVPFAYFLGCNTSSEGEGMGRFVVFVGVGFLAVVAGFTSALLGFARKERMPLLSLIGFIVNGLPAFWLLTH
jgi:heme/copper-type cytochrome/quinol oxidase subunit 4